MAGVSSYYRDLSVVDVFEDLARCVARVEGPPARVLTSGQPLPRQSAS
jgi:hypothetical protein